MYKDWKVERWNTPVSDERLLGMVSLVDDGQLTIVVEDTLNRQFRFIFTDYPAYRNIMEEYRTELWRKLYDKNLGSTLLIVESQWIASFRATEPLLEVHHPNLTHYMICTVNDVVEVLSSGNPKIVEIEKNLEANSRS